MNPQSRIQSEQFSYCLVLIGLTVVAVLASLLETYFVKKTPERKRCLCIFGTWLLQSLESLPQKRIELVHLQKTVSMALLPVVDGRRTRVAASRNEKSGTHGERGSASL